MIKQNILKLATISLCIFAFFTTCKKKDEVKLATLITSEATNITQTTLSLGGNITDDGGGEITERGVCWVIWTAGVDPTVNDSKVICGTGTGAFTCDVSGLAAKTSYRFKAYAINSAGISYGNLVWARTQDPPINFNPDLTYGTVSDIDGNEYKTIVIGTQEWMAENLKVTHSNNYAPIPEVTGDEWINLTTGARCDYQNYTPMRDVWGLYYNYYTVTDSRKLCPTGWHVPAKAEWQLLIDELGGSVEAYKKLREAGTDHWPYSGLADNSSGFTALPGGEREAIFQHDGMWGTWWSTSDSSDYAFTLRIYNAASVFKERKLCGCPVRCVKD